MAAAAVAQPQTSIERAGSFPVQASSKWKAAKMHARYTIVNAVEMVLGSPKPTVTSFAEDEPTVLVGPVIGKVTTTTARILIELDRAARVTITLDAEAGQKTSVARTESGNFLRRAASSQKVSKSQMERLTRNEGHGLLNAEVEKYVEERRPTVFSFTQLKPGTRYSVSLEGCLCNTAASFRTFPEVPYETFNVGVVSCNKIFITQKTITSISDLWAHLAKTIEADKIDLLVHIGDQIYGDGDKRQDAAAGMDRDKWSNRFRMAKDMLSGISENHWEKHREEVCEKYREVYRETWQHPYTARCLANCSNLMIYDDHEVRDNWGDIPEDWDKKSLDFFIAHCAWTVSLEYQRQLFEDVDFMHLNTIEKDNHFHVIGGVGFMFLDIRGSRTFHRIEGDEKPYLGSQQWKDIQKSLMAGGIFDNAQALLVCSPAPLVFLEPTITNTAAKTVNRLEDFKGHWSAHPHQKEQMEMIEKLETWKLSAEKREVLILGGDVHCGGHSIILKSNKVLFHQLTTSAIANMPLPRSAYYFMRAAGQLGKLNGDYAFSHRYWTRARNYAVVQITNHRPQDIGHVEITTQLIKGKFMQPVRMGPQISNVKKNAPGDCSCFSCFKAFPQERNDLMATKT